ncbi:cilia- and flagella-associated protein 77-like [Saccostrea cucullata]|uniref:cilia- and flagella-associated protein 77-like n=1 Tax=Saccostrea cuccullata TaxID=36930 RepID=UPI002ED08F77
MAVVGQNPFHCTAAGELGAHRETMLNNELLLRTELGKPKRRGYGTLGEDFIFGRPNEARHGGADDALHGWPRNLSTTTLPFARKDKKAERDFMALNKAAVQNGLVTAGENYEFRATHDVRRKTAGSENTRLRTRRIPPTMVFGISTRPSTPIFDLLEHKYQDKWLQQRRQQELAKRKEETQNPIMPEPRLSQSAGPYPVVSVANCSKIVWWFFTLKDVEFHFLRFLSLFIFPLNFDATVWLKFECAELISSVIILQTM